MFASLSDLQDYHNLRAAAFNSQARELTQKTADLTESRGKYFVLYLMWGRVSAPTGCSPRESGRLLSSRVGSSLTTSSYCFFFSAVSAAANAGLRAQLGESQTALRAKDAELAALVQERDRLAKKLADQEEGHKAALKAVQDREAALQAEYETGAAGWAEARQTLITGYGQIEDLVDGKLPTPSSFLAVCRFWLVF